MKTRFTLTLLLLASFLSACSRDPEITKRRYLESGLEYAKQHKYEEARIQFLKALKADPRLGEAYYRLGLADVELHKWNDALAHFQQTLELDPNRVDVKLQLGELFAAAHQFDQARDMANAALKADRNNAQAYRLLAHLCIAEQKFRAAEEVLAKVTKLTPGIASSYEELAIVEAGLHQYDQAEHNLQKAVDVDAGFVQGYVNLSTLYRFQNRTAEAEQTLQQGVRMNPDNASLYVAWANMLFADNDKNGAELILQRLRDRQRGGAAATLAIGDFYSAHGSNDQAIGEYQRGISRDPTNIELRNELAASYLNSNKVQQAADLNKAILKDRPEDVRARVLSGRIMLAGGHFPEAISWLRRQVTDSPDLHEAHYFLALAYWQNGSLGEAQTELQEALRLAPSNITLLQQMAKLQLAQGNVSAAKDYAGQGAALAPGDAAGHLLLGMIRLRTADFTGARDDLQLAARLLPKSASPHLNLATVYRADKKWNEAEHELELALALEPRSLEALTAVTDLEVFRNKRDRAILRIRSILAAEPNNANAHFILGSVLEGSARHEAMREFQRALEIDSQMTVAHLRLANLHKDEGHIDDAISEYSKALNLQPKFPPLLTLVGNLYLEGKADLNKARTYYEQAVAVDSTFAPAVANLAYVQAEQGEDLNVALGLAQKAKQMLPDADSISDVLAWVEYLRGSYQETIPMFKECVRKDPARAMYRYHLGMALLATGDRQGAKSQLESALHLNLRTDNAERARSALARLQAD